MNAPTTSKNSRRAPIGRRPGSDPATAWVHRADIGPSKAKASIFTARLTIDVTPALRGRIKVIAFERGVTAADMLRELLEREFPQEVSGRNSGWMTRNHGRGLFCHRGRRRNLRQCASRLPSSSIA